MDTLEIILIVGIVVTILLFILLIVYLSQFVTTRKKYKELATKKIKNKRKRRRLKRELEEYQEKSSKKLKGFLFSFLGFVLFTGGTGYAKFYQSTTISEYDIDNIVYGYYLLEQIEQQIIDIDSNDEKKTSENIHTLAVSLSSFSAKKGSDKGRMEAQILLNQYYSKIGQFGVNISSQNFSELKANKEKQEEYLGDIEKVKSNQNKVIEYYKIDESSLKSKK